MLAKLLVIIFCILPLNAYALEVFFEPEIVRESALFIKCSTNLPDMTNVSVVLLNKELDYSHKIDAVVRDGTFQCGPFQYLGKSLPAGNYTTEIMTGPAMLQPESVQGTIGSKGQHLRGGLVRKGMFGRAVYLRLDFGLL